MKKYIVWLIKKHKKNLWLIASQIIIFFIVYNHSKSTFLSFDETQHILVGIQMSLLLNLAIALAWYCFIKESYSEYKKSVEDR